MSAEELSDLETFKMHFHVYEELMLNLNNQRSYLAS